MNRGEVQKCIEQQFPGFHCESHMAKLYRNSRIFILDLHKGENREKIVVKIARNYNPSQVDFEFQNLSRFFRKAKFGWQPKIENTYLKTFSLDWLDQRGKHAQWPGICLAKKA